MKIEELEKELKTGKLHGLYLLYGEETFLLENCLKKDRSKTQIMGFTRLNLMEITRKHMYSR